MNLPSVEVILSKVKNEIPCGRKEQGELVVELIISLAVACIKGAVSEGAGKLLAALKAGSLGRVSLVIDENGENPILVIGNEDFERDYDPPYIREVRSKSRQFVEKTGLEVVRIAKSEGHKLWNDHGPHHIVRLGNLVAELKQALPKEAKMLIRETKESFEAFNQLEVKKEVQKKNKERESRIQQNMTVLEKILPVTSEEARLVADFIEDIRLDFRKRSVAKIEDWVAIVVHDFETVTTSSTVTDYSTRKAYVFNVKNRCSLVSEKEKRLFRTTETGVIREKYSDEIIYTRIEDGRIVIKLKDGGMVYINTNNAKQAPKRAPR